MLKRFLVFFALFAISLGASAQALHRGTRYAVLLEDQPVAKAVKGRAALKSDEAHTHEARLEAAHDRVKSAIRSRGISIAGETRVLANALYVTANAEQAKEIRELPGVVGVVELTRLQPLLERAKATARVTNAWPILGGRDNAGDGVKVAIIDSGIDNNHPAFANSPLPMPDGFPRTRFASDAPFTNNKVIVARSYVPELADDGIPGGDPGSNEQLQLTRPDDYSARDRVGHGTALAMIVAGQQVNAPNGTISGVAPGAYLGNYKVFGSPRINDTPFTDVVIQAIEDAFVDGMDIAVLSIGAPALWAPDDDVACGNARGVPCELLAAVAGLATQEGMLVVVSAGNSGDSGGRSPGFATITTPGIDPDVLTVGALVNSHEFFRTLQVPGGPGGSLGNGIYKGKLGGTIVPSAPLNATLRDVRKGGDNGLACSPLQASNVGGGIAFIARGSGECTFAVKLQNARNAGAVGAVFYRTDGSDELFHPGGLEYADIPSMLIGSTDGTTLRNYLDGQSNPPNSQINPAYTERDTDVDANNDGIQDGILTSFSSRGPNIGYPLIKPEVTAGGQDIYTATQSYDPNSDMYDPSGYISVDGTSFSAPLVAGVAALILDHSNGFPFYYSEDVKSAIVNAARDVDTNGVINIFDRNLFTGNLEPAYNVAMGGGEVQARWAIDSVVTLSPQTLDFGEVDNIRLANGIVVPVRIYNNYNSDLRMNFERDAYAPAVDQASPVIWTLPGEINVSSGGFRDVTFRLGGTTPSTKDFYDGVIIVRGTGDSANSIPDIKIPYLYIAGDTTPCNIIPLVGNGLTGITSTVGPSDFLLKVTDCRGLPIRNVPISWQVKSGSGQITGSSTGFVTDEYGIAEFSYRMGPEIGIQSFVARYTNPDGIEAEFNVNAIGEPVIDPAGIVEGAGFKAGAAIAPGSFVSLFGVNLSKASVNANIVPLPLALGEVSVSIDTRNRQVSVPARMVYVSPGQVNVFVPWELAGQTSAVFKVNIGDISTEVREVEVNTYAPGIFVYTPGGSSSHFLAAEIFRNNQRIGLHGLDRRARSGDVLELYANGLGPITGGNPASGSATPSDRLYETATKPDVTINGVPANVEFSGLAPGFVGLYQVNITVPGGLSAGEYDVVMKIGGVASVAGRILIE